MSDDLIVLAAKLTVETGEAREMIVRTMIRMLAAELVGKRVEKPVAEYGPKHRWVDGWCSQCRVKNTKKRLGPCYAASNSLPSTTAVPSITGTASILDLE